jgi:uncharacterized membrane protein
MRHFLEWQFGGCLRGLPPAAAWTIVAGAVVAGVALVAWLYRHTLRDLTPCARRTLMLLRAAFLLVLLLCLANPARVNQAQKAPVAARKLAVLVDRSASMSVPDYRGTTRLADAVRVWKRHENEITAVFPSIAYHEFSVAIHHASSLSDAVQAADPGPETHLYSALRETLGEDTSAILCLTDGLDTTGAEPDALAAEALRRAVPLYFIVGQNRLTSRRGSGILNIREIKAPAKVLMGAQFAAELLLEAASSDRQDVPVELWSGTTKLASALLPLRSGLNLLPWSVPVIANAPGLMPLEFRVGENPQQVAACACEVVEHTSLEVLYYQGALQWGYRFLRVAIESDPSFRMTSILNPALGVQIAVNSVNAHALSDLPDDAKALKAFQIVVLAQVFADQLTPKQQQALVEYARAGGGVLFITPGTEATRQFAGTPLEEMLPVVFQPQQPGDALSYGPGNVPINSMRNQLLQDGAGYYGTPALDNLPTLHSFVLPAGGRHSVTAALFQDDVAGLPKFSECATVRTVKPGAEVLAVSGETTNDSSVLLARQQFGRGFTAALTTDLLWRWKLSLPSSSTAVDRFWQQLLRSLTPGTGQGLRIVKQTAAPEMNSPVEILINGTTAESPAAETISPVGEHTPLPLKETSDDEGSSWKGVFTPASQGNWEVRATGGTLDLARLTFAVSSTARTMELINSPADVDGMRRLAESTGGALVEDAPIFQSHDRTDDAPRAQHAQPLWDSSWLLVVLLGFYGTELILRRFLRLL